MEDKYVFPCVLHIHTNCKVKFLALEQERVKEN